MKLFGSLTSPYVRKVRILIAEKGIACDFVTADPAAADSPVPVHNPLGLVPVLVRDGGSALFDSPVIAEYLDVLKAPALIPASGEPRWQVLRLAALADGILDQCVARTMELRRPASRQSPDVNKRREIKIARAIEFAEEHTASGAYLATGRLTLADIALAVALEYIDFRYPHDWRAPNPRLAAWHEGIGVRPAFVATRPPT
ncbi:MAG TPA: glutathione S-transferase N-terminal domain-containing protein [Burkholderiales bacterium]